MHTALESKLRYPLLVLLVLAVLYGIYSEKYWR